MADKNQMNQSSSTPGTEKSHPWRRGSWMASQRTFEGIRSRTSTGFSTVAAKFDDTWGNNAFTETGFTELGYTEDLNGSTEPLKPATDMSKNN